MNLGRVRSGPLALITALLLGATACAGNGDTNGNANGEANGNGEDAGDADGGGGTIAFSFGAEQNEVYPIVAEPARVTAEERGYEFVEGAAFGDCDTQVNDIEGFVARGVDAIVFLPLCGPDPYQGVAADAKEAGITLVGYFDEVPQGDAAIRGDEAQGGEILANEAIRWFEEEFTGDADDFSWVLFTNDPLPASKARTDRARELVVEATGVEPLEAEGVAAEDGLAAMESFLQRDEGINLVIGVNDAVALGAYRALSSQIEETGRDPGEVFVGGIDGQNEALELLLEDGGPHGIYRASAASLIVEFGKAVANVAIDIVEGRDAADVALDYVLFTPADSQEIEDVLAEYEAYVEEAE